jgi:nucleoside-diphosphate-sugar epimerase
MSGSGSKKILVTGGTGFSGSHLVKRLISRGHEVRVVDNQKGFFFDELENLGAKITVGSVTNQSLMEQLVAGCEIVYHVAAAFRRIDLPKEVYWDVNVNGTRYLLDAAHRCGVDRFVYCSTCGVHGNVEHIPAAENAPIQPADYYQFTKYEGEKVAHEYKQKGLKVTILRPAAIYGPGDPERWALLFKRVSSGRFFIFGDGKATYHPLYIDNLTDAFEAAAQVDAAVGQTYLIADEKYYPIEEIVKIIASVLHKPVKITHLPFVPLWAAAVLCEAVCWPLHISPPLFRRRVDWFRQNRAFNIEKAKNELGYRPAVDLKEGLTRTAQWYRENGYLPKGENA